MLFFGRRVHKIGQNEINMFKASGVHLRSDRLNTVGNTGNLVQLYIKRVNGGCFS